MLLVWGFGVQVIRISALIVIIVVAIVVIFSPILIVILIVMYIPFEIVSVQLISLICPVPYLHSPREASC